MLMKGLSDLNKQNLELKDKILAQDDLIEAIAMQTKMLEFVKTKGMSQLLSKLKDTIMGVDDGWTAFIDQLTERADMMKNISSMLTGWNGTTDQQPAEGEGSNTDLGGAVRGSPVQIRAPSPPR